jgi:hypothetical protein
MAGEHRFVDRLWLFSEYEVFGKNFFGEEHDDVHLPYYQNPINRCKGLGLSKSASNWWERSPYASTSTCFCYVYSTGSASYISAGTTRGVCFGFCI